MGRPLTRSAGLSSISGSDSASSSSSDAESTSSSTNAVSRLLQKQKLARAPRAEDDAADELDPAALSGPRSAVIWFEAPEFAPGTQYGVYRALLPGAGAGKKREEGEEVVQELRRLQVPETIKGVEQKPRQWTLLMFGGGHFAGMVVSLVPRMVSKGKGKEKEREVVVVQKKTFHRYTSAFFFVVCPGAPADKLTPPQRGGSREAPRARTTTPRARPTRLELRSVATTRTLCVTFVFPVRARCEY